MYIYVYVCIYVYICICMYICIYVYISHSPSIQVLSHYIQVLSSVYIYMYMYKYKYIYVYIYILYTRITMGFWMDFELQWGDKQAPQVC